MREHFTSKARASAGLAIAACGLASALVHGQGREWTTSGFDAQRTRWVRSDIRLTKAAIEEGEFRFLWKMTFDNEARQLHSLTQPVLQDLLMPGGIDGIETTRRIVERAPQVRVIALTASMDEARMMGVLRAGAAGYLRKDAEPETLLTAVRSVAEGKTYIDPSIGRQILMGAAPADDLTPRETDVLRHLALGRSNKDIARTLGISDETVKTHVGHLLSKLQVENRAQAIVQALRRGLVSLEELEITNQ